MWRTQTTVSTKKIRRRGRGEVRGPRMRWLFLKVVKWNDYDLEDAAAALKRAGHNVSPAEIIRVLEVSCRPRQDKPLIFISDPMVLGPGRNGLKLRMTACGVLLELARRVYAG